MLEIMIYKLPTPDNCEGEDYSTRMGKAYAKSFVLLIETVTLLETIEEYVDNEYGKKLINKFLTELRNHESNNQEGTV
jgi:hypothetical protein